MLLLSIPSELFLFDQLFSKWTWSTQRVYTKQLNLFHYVREQRVNGRKGCFRETVFQRRSLHVILCQRSFRPLPCKTSLDTLLHETMRRQTNPSDERSEDNDFTIQSSIQEPSKQEDKNREPKENAVASLSL